jgi:type IV pilus assembly protein PilN
MYSIDINFLNDREPIPESGRKAKGPKVEIPGKAALMAGGAAAAAFLLITGGALAYLKLVKIPQLEAEKQEIETQLQAFLAKQQELQTIQGNIQLIEGQTQALGSVFNFIKPWSALMQDLRDRLPPGVRVSKIEQKEDKEAAKAKAAQAQAQSKAKKDDKAKEAAPTPPAAPTPSVITISGTATSFTDVNDFLLVLQRSAFLQGEPTVTRLVKAELVENASEKVDVSDANFEGELGKVVEYEIQTQITTEASSEILSELRSKGSVGLVNRVRQLQDIQVIPPSPAAAPTAEPGKPGAKPEPAKTDAKKPTT